MSLHYRAYGLALRSDAPIPGLPPLPPAPSQPPGSPSVAGPVDMVVHWDAIRPPSTTRGWTLLHESEALDDEGRPLFVLERAGEAGLYRLSYGDGTRFWIRTQPRTRRDDGDARGPDEVWAAWPETLTSEDTATYFLGPVLGYLLRTRGRIVLHASAVGLAPVDTGPDGPDVPPRAAGAVALVGPPGAGKSTTAGAFARRGHPVLTEDACALADPGVEGEPFAALPGYPLVRLWPDSVEMLYGQSDALPLLTPTWDKRYLPLEAGGPEAFGTEPLPLRAVVLLAPREDSSDAPRAEVVPPAEAFIELVANTYRNLLLSRDERVEEFRGLHRLLRVTPVVRIVPHADPSRLDALLDLVVGAARDASPPTP